MNLGTELQASDWIEEVEVQVPTFDDVVRFEGPGFWIASAWLQPNRAGFLVRRLHVFGVQPGAASRDRSGPSSGQLGPSAAFATHVGPIRLEQPPMFWPAALVNRMSA